MLENDSMCNYGSLTLDIY